MREWALALSLLAALAGVLSSLAFWFGSETLPAGEQSWDGTSEEELALNKKNRRWNAIALLLLALAFCLSAGSAVTSYFA